MNRITAKHQRMAVRVAAWVCVLVLSAAGLIRHCNAESSAPIVDRWLAVSETVLARHVDPPTRQEMLKSALQAVYKLAQQDAPPGLARQLSQLGDEDQLRSYLQKSLDLISAEVEINADNLSATGIRGMLTSVAGTGDVIPLSEFYVQQQIRDNRYVGIGIQLSMKDDYPTMIRVFPHGPAWKAGGRDGDFMLEIDGHNAKGMALTTVIKLLRGQEGKPATVAVRQPGSNETRQLQMIRGIVPFDTVQGLKRDEDQNWQYRFKVDPRIAYLKIESFRGSTPSELRRIAGRLHKDDCRGLVLDLRGTQSGEMRYAAMVADALLGECSLGSMLGVHGRRPYRSTADQAFPNWPMVVLVDLTTSGEAEWIAAAMKDSRRATLLGHPTAGNGSVQELVELPDGIGGVRLTTGTLFRGNSKPIDLPKRSAASLNPITGVMRQQSEVLRRFQQATGRGSGLKPDQAVRAKPFDEAVALLQEKLKATTTTQKQPAAGDESGAGLGEETR